MASPWLRRSSIATLVVVSLVAVGLILFGAYQDWQDSESDERAGDAYFAYREQSLVSGCMDLKGKGPSSRERILAALSGETLPSDADLQDQAAAFCKGKWLTDIRAGQPAALAAARETCEGLDDQTSEAARESKIRSDFEREFDRMSSGPGNYRDLLLDGLIPTMGRNYVTQKEKEAAAADIDLGIRASIAGALRDKIIYVCPEYSRLLAVTDALAPEG